MIVAAKTPPLSSTWQRIGTKRWVLAPDLVTRNWQETTPMSAPIETLTRMTDALAMSRQGELPQMAMIQSLKCCTS